MLRSKITLFLFLTFFSNLTAKTSTDVQAYAVFMKQPIDSLEKLAALYPKSAEELNARLKVGIELAQMEIDEITKIPADHRTFDNTIRALDLAYNNVKRLLFMGEVLGGVSPEQGLREAAQKAEQSVRKLQIDLSFKQSVYRAVQEYLWHKPVSEQLSDVNKRLLDGMIKGFKRDGLYFRSSTLSELKQLKAELAQLEQAFVLNMDGDQRTVSVSFDEMKGLSDNLIGGLKREGDRYLLGIDFVTYGEVMQKCQVAETRRKVFIAFKNGAYPDNDVILKAIIQKRDRLAKLLMYENFSAFDIEDSMAKNISTVEVFLTNMLDVASKKALKEFNFLKQNLPEGVACNSDGSLQPWDYEYVLDRYKQKHFAVDEARVSEYFSVQKVIDGTFAIYQKFLGLRFKEVKPLWSWHEEVRLIEIYHQETNKFLGYLFLDLYPRSYKSKFVAAHYSQVPSCMIDGQQMPSVSVIIANLSKPCCGNPELLKHADATIFFHEFGHAMHTVMGRTEHAQHSGTNVKADFVEMPSQMFEEWMFESEILAMVSSHYQTGEPLPAEIIEKKVALKKFDAGFRILDNALWALFALRLMQDTHLSQDPALLCRSLYEKYFASMLQFEPEDHCYASFWHLSQPRFYASKVYGYLWSQVFALDVFAEVKRNGFNASMSKKIQNFLAAGGSIEPGILLRDFLGREPNQDAFLQVFGLSKLG